MSREDIKTMALIGLVIMSLFLTSEIWFETASIERSPVADNNGFVDDNINVLDVIGPGRVAVHLGEDKIKLLNPADEKYPKAWLQGINAIKSLLERDKLDTVENVDEKVWQELKRGRCLEFIFDHPFDLEFWGKALNLKKRGTAGIKLSRLLIKEDSDSVFIFDGEKQSYHRISTGKNGDIAQLLEEIGNSDEIEEYTELPYSISGLTLEQGIYVPKNPQKVSDIKIKGEDIKPDRLARDFFNDMSIVRKIEEKDGARIYTDGRKGLRIYPTGAVEYNYAIIHDKREYSNDLFDATKISYSFITTYGGLPKEAYLDEVKTVDYEPKSHIFIYNYRYNGIPVLGEKRTIEVIVTQGEVKNYFRHLEHPVSLLEDSEKLSITPVKALEIVASNLRFLIGVHEDEHSIRDIYPAYYRIGKEQEYIRFVWVIEFKDLKLFVDAAEGKIISGNE